MNARWNKTLALALCGLGAAAMLCGVGLVAYNLWDDAEATRRVETVAEEIDARIAGAEDKRPDGQWDVIEDYELDPGREMPAVEIDGYRYVGKIAVPSLDLELPVMEEWDYPRLKIAPCRYCGTAYQPNFAICAHNYTSHFGRLKNLAAGDEVTFTDMDGNVFRYRVALVETLKPTAVEEVRAGGWDLTLFTCTLGGRTRVTVRCDKTEE